MEPVFIAVVMGILFLSGSLLAEDVRSLHAAERRRRLCPAYAR